MLANQRLSRLRDHLEGTSAAGAGGLGKVRGPPEERGLLCLL